MNRFFCRFLRENEKNRFKSQGIDAELATIPLPKSTKKHQLKTPNFGVCSTNNCSQINVDALSALYRQQIMSQLKA
jgi:hypothetical protein